MEGISIIIFNGWGFKRGVWEQMIGLLSGEYSLIFGDEKSKVEGALEEGGKLYAMGWSKGGMEAVEFTIRNAERVAGLVLFSTTAKFTRGDGCRYGWKKSILEKMKDNLEKDMEAVLEDFSKNIFSEEDKREGGVKEFLKNIQKQYERDREVLELGLDYLIETDIREDLARLNLDILLIHGEEDRIVLPYRSEDMESKLGNRVYREVIKGVGHAPMLAKAVYCAKRANEFFRGEVYDR